LLKNRFEEIFHGCRAEPVETHTLLEGIVALRQALGDN